MTDRLRRELALRVLRACNSVDDINALPPDTSLMILEVLFEVAPVTASRVFRDHIEKYRADYIDRATKRLGTLRTANPVDLQEIREVEALLDVFRKVCGS